MNTQVGQRHGDVEGNWVLKGLVILHQERRGYVKTVVMEHTTVSSSTSPDLITSRIPISQLMLELSSETLI